MQEVSLTTAANQQPQNNNSKINEDLTTTTTKATATTTTTTTTTTATATKAVTVKSTHSNTKNPKLSGVSQPLKKLNLTVLLHFKILLC
jgi:hypothetical protein